MLKIIYFLLLGISSLEDFKYHKVNGWLNLALVLLGLLRVGLYGENRWVDITLAFLCFFLLYLLYRSLPFLSVKCGKMLRLGGSDVRLIPTMVLVQGWEGALCGVFLGLLGISLLYLVKKNKEREMPLVPWMTLGCFVIEFGKKVIYFL